MVIREVLLLIGRGLAAGIALVLAFANLIRSQLYGLNAHGTLRFMGAAFVLMSSAALPVSSRLPFQRYGPDYRLAPGVINQGMIYLGACLIESVDLAHEVYTRSSQVAGENEGDPLN